MGYQILFVIIQPELTPDPLVVVDYRELKGWRLILVMRASSRTDTR